MPIIRIGVDLAKNVFAGHGVHETGKVVLARTVRHEQLLEVLGAVPPRIVAM
jgi:transposase